MNKLEVTAIALVLGTSAMTLGTAVSAMTEQKEVKPSTAGFETFDVDKNGVISTREAIKDPVLQSVFKKIDENGDEQLSKDEYLSYEELQVKKSG